ncbi:MAG: uracil-DNA glycosylase [Elusimicrobia bacterium]|nr:uracil-DNA glycosylase [Elusimicrobiota bacterium]
MGNDELLELTRRLRRRVEQSPRCCWRVGLVPSGERKTNSASRLAEIAERVARCQLCPLGRTRGKTVPGAGSPEARVMFVGEGPGFMEDRRGEPFVGPAGELLDRILAAIGLSRQAVFIANMVKCRPMKDPSRPEARGNDRPPSPEELSACRPYIAEQIRVLAPRVIVALGAVAARALLVSEAPIGRLRGTWAEYRDGSLAVKVLPTYHPAALLRNPELKKDVWKDMKALRAELEQG